MLKKISIVAATGLLGTATLFGSMAAVSSTAEAGYRHRHHHHHHHHFKHRHHHHGYYGYRYYRPVYAYSHCKVWKYYAYHRKCVVWW